MKKFILGITALLCTANVLAYTTQWINHDKVQPIWQGTVTNGSQRSAFTFQPYLSVEGAGCVPFPAVDWWGHVGGGLKPTGNAGSNCGHSTGQIYERATWSHGRWAIMYSWYFPKDEPSPGIGHRHDWENVVVWINNPESTSQQMYFLTPSQHGGYLKFYPQQLYMSGTHPRISYSSAWPLDHALNATVIQGGTQPLVFWEQLSQAAQDALNFTDFGAANVPFSNGNFMRNIEKSWNAGN